MEDLWTTNAGNPIISAGHESPRSESNVTSVAKLNTFDYQGKKNHWRLDVYFGIFM